MFDRLLNDVKKLSLPKGEYALFGSSPIIVRGIRAASHDIDILVTEELWNQYRVNPAWEVRTLDNGDEFLEWASHDIELYKKWGPGEWNVQEILASAEEIGGVMYVPLETVLQWKKHSARPKDLADVELIEGYLK